MSGEPPPRIVLQGNPAIQRIIGALAELANADPSPCFVLAGGLAVMARIGRLYRVTLDLDAVTAYEAMFVEIITDLDAGSSYGNHLYLNGVKIDVLAIDDATHWADIAQIDDTQGRLFATSLLWANQEATPLTIVGAATSATVAVASTRSLLVTKLSAYHSTRRALAKRSSDSADLYSLLGACVTGDGLFHPPIPGPVVTATRDALEETRGNIALFQTRLRSSAVAPDVTGAHLAALCNQVIADLDEA